MESLFSRILYTSYNETLTERIGMFNRTFTIRMEKRNKDDIIEKESGDQTFDKKADAVLYRVENLGAKIFLGVCVYVLLDTFRQVKVAQAIYTQES